jgi:hypothetical protein
MGAEHQYRTRRHVSQFLDEDRAFPFRSLTIGVVNTSWRIVNRCAKFGQRALNDLDGANHPRAKAARLSQQNFKGLQV